jgi:hypothetical protein
MSMLFNERRIAACERQSFSVTARQPHVSAVQPLRPRGVRRDHGRRRPDRAAAGLGPGSANPAGQMPPRSDDE